MLFGAAAVMQAQPELNDTLRTSTWGFYIQGGVAGFHGMNGQNDQYTYDTPKIAPSGDLGLMFFPRPWVRFGLDLGYTYLKSSDKNVLPRTEIFPNTEKEGLIGDLEINSSRLQNRNFTNMASTDLTLGINFVEIWRERESQWFNIWTSIGAGYMHGWNTHTYTWAVDENLVSKDDGHMSIWNHSHVNSYTDKNQFNAWYIPLILSMEFDLSRRLTLGLVGEYKYFPQKYEHAPTGIWNAGVSLRFNFGYGKYRHRRRHTYEAPVVPPQIVRVESRVDTVYVVKEEKEPVYNNGFLETEVPLADYAVQIYAFRIYQHAPDDKIFHGDNPVIYKNGDLRRYVLFADTLEEARNKLQSVKHKYPDAFIVTIRKDGLVVPYHAR